MSHSNPTLLDKSIIAPAIGESFRKLDPRLMVKNPVMFVTQIGAVLTTIEGGYVVRPVVGELGPSATSGNVALDRAWVTAACGVAWMF